MCLCVSGFLFFKYPTTLHPPPGITLTFPLPVKLLRSTLVLLFPSSSLLLSLYSSFLLPSTFGDVSRAFYSSPRRLSLHSVTPSRSPSHCPFFTAAHPPTPPPLRHYSMCKMNFTRRNLLLTRRAPQRAKDARWPAQLRVALFFPYSYSVFGLFDMLRVCDSVFRK